MTKDRRHEALSRHPLPATRRSPRCLHLSVSGRTNASVPLPLVLSVFLALFLTLALGALPSSARADAPAPAPAPATAPATSAETAPTTPAGLTVVVLDDVRCKDCHTDEAIAALRGEFPALQVRRLDYALPEAKVLFGLMKAQGIGALPAFLFRTNELSAAANRAVAESLEPYLFDVGEFRLLRTDAQFDPTAEICDNGGVDDDGDSLADCADDGCANTPLCRPEAPKQLDLFVMSQCPFALQAEASLDAFLAAIGPDVDFRMHFIVDHDGKQFQSLHGQPEVDENLRQACAQKHYGKGRKFLKYVACRNKARVSGDWKKCAVGGISAKVIDECARGKEGLALLEADMRLVNDLGINGSPTWMANNRHLFMGLSPEAIRQGFCARNSGLKGCEKTLSDDAGNLTGGCGM